MTCPTCGSPRRETVSRGPMTVRENPPELFWHGIKVPMGALKVRLLALLLRFGKVSTGALEMLLSDDAAAKALAVHFCQIRRIFQQRDIPVRIESIRGWGYKIEVAGTTE